MLDIFEWYYLLRDPEFPWFRSLQQACLELDPIHAATIFCGGTVAPVIFGAFISHPCLVNLS